MKEDLENGEDVASCPSCSLIVKVIYDKVSERGHQRSIILIISSNDQQHHHKQRRKGSEMSSDWLCEHQLTGSGLLSTETSLVSLVSTVRTHESFSLIDQFNCCLIDQRRPFFCHLFCVFRTRSCAGRRWTLRQRTKWSCFSPEDLGSFLLISCEDVLPSGAAGKHLNGDKPIIICSFVTIN